jgi:hypothetical protein
LFSRECPPISEDYANPDSDHKDAASRFLSSDNLLSTNWPHGWKLLAGGFMKYLFIIPGLFFLMAYTHPFAEQGSVDNDSEVLQERVKKAEENRKQEQEAKEAVQKQKQKQEEIDRSLQPDILFQDKKEGSVE